MSYDFTRAELNGVKLAYFIMPIALLDHLENDVTISEGSKLLFQRLFAFACSKKQAEVGVYIDHLAKRFSRTRRTISRRLHELRKSGYLEGSTILIKIGAEAMENNGRRSHSDSGKNDTKSEANITSTLSASSPVSPVDNKTKTEKRTEEEVSSSSHKSHSPSSCPSNKNFVDTPPSNNEVMSVENSNERTIISAELEALALIVGSKRVRERAEEYAKANETKGILEEPKMSLKDVKNDTVMDITDVKNDAHNNNSDLTTIKNNNSNTYEVSGTSRLASKPVVSISDLIHKSFNQKDMNEVNEINKTKEKESVSNFNGKSYRNHNEKSQSNRQEKQEVQKTSASIPTHLKNYILVSLKGINTSKSFIDEYYNQIHYSVTKGAFSTSENTLRSIRACLKMIKNNTWRQPIGM